MNDYLASLIRQNDQNPKDDEVTEQVVNSDPVDAPKLDDNEVEVSDVQEASSADEVVNSTSDKNVSEEIISEPVVDEEVDTGENTVSPDEILEIDLETTEVEDDEDKGEAANTTPFNVGDMLTVKDVKIFNVPDSKSAFKIISGNVTYLGTVGDFDLVYYMKYGFGLVKGYTQDLRS